MIFYREGTPLKLIEIYDLFSLHFLFIIKAGNFCLTLAAVVEHFKKEIYFIAL